MNSIIDWDKNFFGRSAVLALLKRRVLDLKEGYRQNVAILGNQYVGKSSLLHYFLYNLDEDDVTVIYLDLEQKDFGYFTTKFIGSLLYSFSKRKQLPLHEDISLLLESVKPFIPHTVEVIKKIQKDFESRKLAECFLGLMTLPEIYTNETGKFCVLILDEFQNIEEFDIPNVFQDLGKKIMTQKKCLYVFASSYPVDAKKILSERLSLLFGNFEIIPIEPFDTESCQQFIDASLKGLKIGGQLRSFLIDFTGGHPLYLNLICRELTNLSAIHRQVEVYLPILTQAVENTIFDRWGVISRHFELIMNELCQAKGQHVNSCVLVSLTNGHNKIEDLVADLDLRKSVVQQKVNRLIELGVIVKNGNYHYLKDKLFKYWIKYVYQRRFKEIEFTPDKQRKQFKDEFNRLVDHFNISARKDLSSRVAELLGCFDKESFRLNGRLYKLPAFTNVVHAKLKSEGGVPFDIMRASTNQGTWLVVTKKDTFLESDLLSILNEARKFDKKPIRYLLISLSDLDENTRVRALQEKFWIWNELELNTLLTLFDKPYIAK